MMGEIFETLRPIVSDVAAKKRAVPMDETPTKMGRPMGLRGPLRELAEALGGVEKLANEIGMTDRTVRRWSAGMIVPPRPVRLLLAGLARHHGITPPFDTGETCARPAWLDEDPDEAEV